MKPISRRTMLRGAGAAIALPFLNAMLPATSLLAKNIVPPVASGPRRMAMMYIPNGVIGKKWFPTETGNKYKLPVSLEPLSEYQNDITIISGLRRVFLSGEPHSQAGSCWMTSAKPNERTDGVAAIDRTLDQIIAKRVGEQTAFPSIELSCNQFVDNAEPKVFDSISWYGPGNDAKSMNDPRKVFERLFGQSAEIKTSVLDTILEDANSMQRKLGQDDRRKLDEYLASVRAVEQRLSRQNMSRNGIKSFDFTLPEKLPTNRGEFIRLMGDLMVLAFQTDQTRVASMMVGPERWSTPQLFDGVFDSPVNHHVMTHDHRYDEDVAKIDMFHVQQYTYLIKKMKSIQEGESNLLDNCCFVLGSGIGDGATHSYNDLPVIIAGGLGNSITTGRHMKADAGTPLANLWLTLANIMGADLTEFADSTRMLDINSERLASRK